jgi:hypothetical protein
MGFFLVIGSAMEYDDLLENLDGGVILPGWRWCKIVKQRVNRPGDGLIT